MSTTQALARRLSERGIWQSTQRNVGIGFLIGGVVLIIQFNKARKSKKRWQRFKREWIIYLMKYPLFLVSFTFLYKSLNQIGRKLIGNQGLLKNGERTIQRKFAIASSAFLCGYIAQLMSPVFSWNWALYAFLRSILGLLRLLVPKDLHPRSVNVYSIVHGFLPIFICFHTRSMPKSFYAFFKASLDENRSRYCDMFSHSHGILPPCSRILHSEHESCLKSFVYDFFLKFKVEASFVWYLKFYMLTSVLGGILFLKKIIKSPVSVLRTILMQTLRSCMFLTVAFQIPSRTLCFTKWLLERYHWKYRKDEFTVIADHLPMQMFVVSAIFGGIFMRLERSKTKHTDIALFSIWKMMEQLIRLKCSLNTFDDDSYHPVLSNIQLPAILFGCACALSVYVQITDENALKSLEKRILQSFLG